MKNKEESLKKQIEVPLLNYLNDITWHSKLLAFDHPYKLNIEYLENYLRFPGFEHLEFCCNHTTKTN